MGRGMLLAALLLLSAAGPALAAPPPADAGPRLRNWHLGLQGVGVRRDGHDVFGLAGLPPGPVDENGSGAGVILGRRFGDRFLLGLQVTAAVHDITGSEQTVTDFEFLVTGTVLFRERRTLQPFLRGGVGGGGEALNLEGDGGHLAAIGTTAIAGGGLQIRLGSRVSLDLETVASFANILEVFDESEGDLWPDDSWQVRHSTWGWRTGLGVMVWF